MDIRTGEISDFKNQQELEEAKKNNPYLIEVDCDKKCELGIWKGEKFFCIANRSQRRRIKCQVKKK
ncbi:MAG: hypothetical protein E3J76_01950 [Candidatus Aminicenantes bacterium]|nr:MAG: hypothetical protein E3J76_01950 [Candidatus Aminicenantes bacterium]